MKSCPYILIVVFIFVGCQPSRIVRPLEKGERAIGINIGGPLIGFAGTTIPMPFTALSYAQGITDKTTVYGSVQTSSLLFNVFHTDIGAVHNLYYSDSSRVGISINPALNIAYDNWEGNFKTWPQLDVNVYWETKPGKSFFYAGVDNWFEFSGERAHEEPQTKRWLINPQIGYTNARKKWNHSIEMKWLVPGVENKPNAVKYRGVGGKGAIGIYLTFTRKF